MLLRVTTPRDVPEVLHPASADVSADTPRSEKPAVEPVREDHAGGETAEPGPSTEGRRGTTQLTILTLIAVVGVMWLAKPILIPLVLGALLSYALDPVHRRIVALGVPAPLSSACVLLAFVGGLWMSAYAVRGQAAGFINQLPVATEKVHDLIRGIGVRSGSSAIGQVQQAAAELKKAADESTPAPPQGVTRVQVEDPPMRMGDVLWRASTGAIGFVEQFTIILFLVFYLLASGDLYKRKIVRIAGPSLSQKRITVEILNEITAQIERFMIARVLVSGIVGTATGVAFWALGVSSPAMWALGAGVLNTVPYVGPCAVAAAAGVAGLLQFGDARMAVVLSLTSLAIAAFEGSFVTPWLMGRAGRMNAGAVFIGLSFLGWIWGVWGLLLAVPILMVVKAVCDHVEGWTPVSELLGE